MSRKNSCFLANCKGNDAPVGLFHGICYRCLHNGEIGQVKQHGGYDVKIWRLGDFEGARATVALAGWITNNRWDAALYAVPRSHMDENKAIEEAVFQADLARKGPENA